MASTRQKIYVSNRTLIVGSCGSVLCDLLVFSKDPNHFLRPMTALAGIPLGPIERLLEIGEVREPGDDTK